MTRFIAIAAVVIAGIAFTTAEADAHGPLRRIGIGAARVGAGAVSRVGIGTARVGTRVGVGAARVGVGAATVGVRTAQSVTPGPFIGRPVVAAAVGPRIITPTIVPPIVGGSITTRVFTPLPPVVYGSGYIYP